MNTKFMDDNYLAKWLNAEITDETLKSLVGEADFKVYFKIKKDLERFESPLFDTEAQFKRLKSKIQLANVHKQKAKDIKLIPTWAYSVAASVALLLAAYLFFFADTTLSTNFGEQTAFNLLDGSYVKLNSKSTLSYNKRTWAADRVVNLNGEAYFEVQHGKTFTVTTKIGNVRVLGTHFNVKTGANYLNVTCFEGKVEVLVNNKKMILTPGQTYQFAENTEFNWTVELANPTWINGLNTYQNTPLFVILNDLESQFKIKIDASKIDKNALLNASFENNDLNMALKTIFVPLNFDYQIKNNKVILAKK